MQALLIWLSGALANLLGYQVARFAAWKVLLWTLAISVFPILITNAIYSIIQTVMSIVNNHVSGSGLQGGILAMTGLAAWLATELRLQEALSLIMSAVMFRMALGMVPFVKL